MERLADVAGDSAAIVDSRCNLAAHHDAIHRPAQNSALRTQARGAQQLDNKHYLIAKLGRVAALDAPRFLLLEILQIL